MKSLFILLLLSLNSFADSDLEKTIFVSGKCKKNISPDRVSVTITVEQLDKKQAASSEKATKKYNNILKQAKSMKLKNAEYETTEYRVFAHNPWENRKQVFKGYKTRISLKISTSEMNKAGALLSLGNKLGLDSVRGPDSFVSDELYDKVYKNCLKIALKDAKDKGAILAAASGRKLGKVIAIKEGSGGYQHPPTPLYKSARMEMAMDARASAPPAQIEYGKQSINMSLSVYFDIN